MYGKAECEGWTQMKDVAVWDCNRIIGKDYFTTADRHSFAKSWLMFQILTRYYVGHNADMNKVLVFWKKGINGMRKELNMSDISYIDKAHTIKREVFNG